MPSPITLLSGTSQTILSTELNSLANNARALGSAITLTSADYVRSLVELYISGMGGTPTANTCFRLWLLRTVDATNYEDGDSSTTPLRRADQFFPIRATSGAQRIIQELWLPPGTFKALLLNDATGQALAASSNTVKLLPYTEQI